MESYGSRWLGINLLVLLIALIVAAAAGAVVAQVAWVSATYKRGVR